MWTLHVTGQRSLEWSLFLFLSFVCILDLLVVWSLVLQSFFFSFRIISFIVKHPKWKEYQLDLQYLNKLTVYTNLN